MLYASVEVESCEWVQEFLLKIGLIFTNILLSNRINSCYYDINYTYTVRVELLIWEIPLSTLNIHM